MYRQDSSAPERLSAHAVFQCGCSSRALRSPACRRSCACACTRAPTDADPAAVHAVPAPSHVLSAHRPRGGSDAQSVPSSARCPGHRCNGAWSRGDDDASVSPGWYAGGDGGCSDRGVSPRGSILHGAIHRLPSARAVGDTWDHSADPYCPPSGVPPSSVAATAYAVPACSHADVSLTPLRARYRISCQPEGAVL